MPTTLTEDGSTFPTDVTVPAAGDPVRAGPGSYLRAALQTLTNRSRWAYNLLTNGIPRVRVVSTIADMKAIVAPPNGSVAMQFGGSSPKLFIFVVYPSPPAQVTGFLYPADDGTGFWASEMYYLVTGSSGNLRLDPAVLSIQNRLFDVQHAADTSSTTASESPGSAFGPSITVNGVKTGDILLIDGQTQYEVNGSVGGGYIYIAINGSKVARSARFWSNNGMPDFSDLFTSLNYVATGDGNVTVQMWQMASSISSGNPHFNGNRTLRVMTVRP